VEFVIEGLDIGAEPALYFVRIYRGCRFGRCSEGEAHNRFWWLALFAILFFMAVFEVG